MPAKRKKIALFHLYLYRGGGERVLVDLARGFVDRGYAVDLVLMRATGPYLGDVPDSVRVVDFQSRRILETLPRLIRYLRRERPWILLSITKHTHLISLWARMIARTRTKVVLRIGIPFSLSLYRGRNYREYLVPLLVKIFYRYADAIVANSRGLAEDFIKTTGVPRKKVHVIFNPKHIARIEESARQPVCHPWLADKTEPVIIASGRLTRQKGFDVLIRALADVRSKMPARLIILGSGECLEELRRESERLGVADSVSFVGFVENPYAYYAHADAFALSSRWEGLPNVAIEALICGLPVVAADCPYGPREILAPDTDVGVRTKRIEYARYGVLVPADDPFLLAAALCGMLQNDTERRAYAARARGRGGDFDAAMIVEAYDRLFSELVQ